MGATGLEKIAAIVDSLGHEVVGRETDLASAAATTEREQPDIAFFELGETESHALDLITTIATAAACSVVALLDTDHPHYIKEASKRGVVFASIGRPSGTRWRARSRSCAAASPTSTRCGRVWPAGADRAGQGDPDGAHGIEAQAAFELLRKHSQRTGTRVVDAARDITEYRSLLPDRGRAPGR